MAKPAAALSVAPAGQPVAPASFVPQNEVGSLLVAVAPDNAHLGSGGEAVGTGGGPGAGNQRSEVGVVGAPGDPPLRVDDGGKLAECRIQRGHVGIDVGVVELQRGDDREGGIVVEELRLLVEEGSIVLISLDDEMATAAQAAVGPEVHRDAPDQEGGVTPGAGQQPGDQRGDGGFAVGSGHYDRGLLAQEEPADCLGHRDEFDSPPLCLDHLGVVSAGDIADHDHLRGGGQVGPVVAHHDGNAPLPQQLAHGRVGRGIGALNFDSLLLEHGCDAGHGRPADSDKVRSHGSSPARPGPGPGASLGRPGGLARKPANCGSVRLYPVSRTRMAAIAAGVTPGMRAACPRDNGRARSSFSAASVVSPGRER